MGLCFAPSAWNIWEPLEIYFLMVWDDKRTPGDQWWWWCVKCTCMHACVSARVYLCVYVCVHGTWLDSHPGALVCVPVRSLVTFGSCLLSLNAERERNQRSPRTLLDFSFQSFKSS